MTNIFEERRQVLPYEYPELIEYTRAIWDSFWHDNHFTYDRDVRDYKVALTPTERSIVKKSMLAISVVENKVKSFWGLIGLRMPKSEIKSVGHVFAGNEVVHQFAYQRLLTELSLEEEFAVVDKVDCMVGREKYLKRYLQGVKSRSNKEFTKSLILFTLLIENCSLFSQFLIISSFSKYKNLLKNFAKVINATAREEVLHGMFGASLIAIIKKENPDWFDEEMEEKTRRAIRKAFKAEKEVLDWIFEEGQLDFISKEEVTEYLKSRLNNSLSQIGYEPEYVLNKRLLEKSSYLDRMLIATKDFDFFDGKASDYSTGKSFSSGLWD